LPEAVKQQHSISPTIRISDRPSWISRVSFKAIEESSQFDETLVDADMHCTSSPPVEVAGDGPWQQSLELINKIYTSLDDASSQSFTEGAVASVKERWDWCATER